MAFECALEQFMRVNLRSPEGHIGTSTCQPDLQWVVHSSKLGNKMKMKKIRISLLALASTMVLAFGNSAHAALITEAGDAGKLTTTAQTSAGSGAIDAIRGTLLTSSGDDYADIFRIYLNALILRVQQF
jgi:hypothetical protein